MTRWITKIRENITQLGLGTTILYLIDRAGNGLGLQRWIFVYAITAQRIGLRRILSADRMTEIDVKILRGYTRDLDGLPITRNLAEERFANGSICVCVSRRSELIGCVWFSRDTHIEDEVRCRYVLAPKTITAWDFDVFVPERLRGGLTFALVWQAAEEYLCAEGVDWSLSRISAFNVKSLTAHERLGATRLGRVVFLLIGPVQLMFSTLTPRFHCSWSDSSLPDLRVSVTSAPAAQVVGRS